MAFIAASRTALSGHSIQLNATVSSPVACTARAEIRDLAGGHVVAPRLDDAQRAVFDEDLVNSPGVIEERLFVCGLHRDHKAVNVSHRSSPSGESG